MSIVYVRFLFYCVPMDNCSPRWRAAYGGGAGRLPALAGSYQPP